MSVDTPHFAFPLRYVNGHAVVNQQDSMNDIAACVEAVCLTNPGDRVEWPEFGVTDMTFAQQPIPLNALVGQIETFEPRATILITEDPDQFDAAVVNADINIVVAQ